MFKNILNLKYKPIFICGAAGSGTTLFCGLLDQNYKNILNLKESALRFHKGAKLHVNPLNSYNSLNDYIENACKIKDDTNLNKIRQEYSNLYYKYSKKIKFLASNIIFDKAPNLHLTRIKILDNVFPDSRYILIFRDPRDNIEGWIRKWKLFKQTPLTELINFWNFMYSTFYNYYFNHKIKVIYIEYEQFILNYKKILKSIGEDYNIKKRSTKKLYSDINNKRGKGLSNVTNGIIKVSINKTQLYKKNLSKDNANLIYKKTKGIYQKLLNESNKYLLQNGIDAKITNI